MPPAIALVGDEDLCFPTAGGVLVRVNKLEFEVDGVIVGMEDEVGVSSNLIHV
jgi:hypothetical protein